MPIGGMVFAEDGLIELREEDIQFAPSCGVPKRGAPFFCIILHNKTHPNQLRRVSRSDGKLKYSIRFIYCVW